MYINISDRVHRELAAYIRVVTVAPNVVCQPVSIRNHSECSCGPEGTAVAAAETSKIILVPAHWKSQLFGCMCYRFLGHWMHREITTHPTRKVDLGPMEKCRFSTTAVLSMAHTCHTMP